MPSLVEGSWLLSEMAVSACIHLVDCFDAVLLHEWDLESRLGRMGWNLEFTCDAITFFQARCQLDATSQMPDGCNQPDERPYR